MSDQIYLTLHTMPNGSSTSVGIDRAEALRLDRKGFARLYRKTCCGSSRREANAWADRQIAERAAALSPQGQETA